ncbi:MAG: hypothetical protein ACYDIA_05580 [Candidatus Humimicrobiaceae bacterium]
MYINLGKKNMENSFIKKFQKGIWGMNSSFDREIITGSIIPISYAVGVMKYLSVNRILLKDFTCYAETLAKKIKDNATATAQTRKCSISISE